jgi:hypothetical protein
MAGESDQWFVAERSRTLALMYLSHRRDLRIKDQRDAGIGLDLLVYIVKESESPSLRPFGIALGGTVSPVNEEQRNKLLRPTLQSLLRIGQFPYPVGLLHFTMQDNQGYFTWIAEPAVTRDDPQLLIHSEPHPQKMDREVLDRIVEQVDRWYDAFYAKIAVKAS